MPDQPPPPSVIEHISTRWPLLHQPAQFVLRYAPAIRRYLGALLRNPEAVHDVSQDFLLRILEQRFVPPEDLRGRFRDYLKAAVRNAAFAYLRKNRRTPVEQSQDVADDAALAEADRAWLDEWQHCLMERAWEALEAHQHNSPGNLAYTTLRLSVGHPEASSAELAEMLAKQTGRPVRADALRQQVSRARRLFAQLLAREAGRTLQSPTRAAVLDELGELQLRTYVQPYIDEGWSV